MKIFKKTLILFLVTLIFTCQFTQVEGLVEVSAQAYIVVDAESGRIIKSRNADVKLPIASTTKIMTTIVALENVENLNTRIEVPSECAGIEGSSIYLRPKQRVSIIDLLYGTMLRSGNDASETLSKFISSKNPQGFIHIMNSKAVELGALNTNFVNPSGLHNKDHYSTAYDLALISSYAMKNNTFSEIARAENYKATSLDSYFYNKNKVVHQYDHGTGIKIGYTKAAGRCLVASAEKEGTEIIVVLLNDNNWFNESYQIFDWVFENYKTYSIVEKGQFVTYNEGSPVFIDESFKCVLTEEEKEKIRFEPFIEIPTIDTESDTIRWGYYNIYLGEDIIHTGNLVNE